MIKREIRALLWMISDADIEEILAYLERESAQYIVREFYDSVRQERAMPSRTYNDRISETFDPYDFRESPRHRETNDDITDDFVAIDFETMTGKRSSACAIGMVRVIDGCIAQQFYSLINPIRDEYTDIKNNSRSLGIPLEEAEKAPTFAELFPIVKNMIGDLPIVAHNATFDMGVFAELMRYYNLTGINLDNYRCTYSATGLNLKDCCAKYNIPSAKHHDALFDAYACAQIYLNIIGKPSILTPPGFNYAKVRMPSDTVLQAKSVDKSHRGRLDDEFIENKDTPFYGSKTVITGVLSSFPSRDDLAAKVQSLGGSVMSTITKRTNIVIIGEGAGPKKLQTIDELRAAGHTIRTIDEAELISILNL